MANSITNPVDTFVPTEFFAKNWQNATQARTLLSGESAVRGDLLMSNAAGKLVAHDGTVGTPGFVAAATSDASAADNPVSIYKVACIYADKISWPAAATTDELKAALLETTGVGVVFSQGGY